jgi:hypothetical protein
MIHRVFDPERDREQSHRIWKDCGWLEKDKEGVMDTFVDNCRALVGDIDGVAEGLVLSSPASVMYLDRELSMSAVCGVTTSYVARKRGLAARLTSELLALDVAEGAEMAGLGMFEQGYYDMLGFGTGSYETWFDIDPAHLQVDVRPPVPKRLSMEDWEAVHGSRLNRMRSHGSVCLERPELTKADMEWSKNSFGLGYFDSSGNLTHHFWCCHEGGEHGPYFIPWMSFRDHCQLLELLGLIRGLGDQVHTVRICEPRGIQLQDLLQQPFKYREVTKGSKHQYGVRCSAYWQMRICSLEKCLAKTHLDCGHVRFGLRLVDPLEKYLDHDAPWRGVSGEYTVVLGPESSAVKGIAEGMPVMEASVGAFTRMWLGVRPATGIAVTDRLAAPRSLLDELDALIRIPAPHTDWDF